LDNFVRRAIHDPKRIFSKYVKPGHVVLDVGCGPGTFAMDLAKMVGDGGRVIAADLQQGMLDKLSAKLEGSGMGKRVMLVKATEDSLNVQENVDFAVAFYMAHEVPDQERLFREIHSLLKPDGVFLLVEPVIHVSRGAFDAEVLMAEKSGLKPLTRDSIPLSQAVAFKRG